MNNIGMIGLNPQELSSVRTFVRLLRNPDPVLAELARQALAYLEVMESRSNSAQPLKPQLLNRFHNQNL